MTTPFSAALATTPPGGEHVDYPEPYPTRGSPRAAGTWSFGFSTSNSAVLTNFRSIPTKERPLCNEKAARKWSGSGYTYSPRMGSSRRGRQQRGRRTWTTSTNHFMFIECDALGHARVPAVPRRQLRPGRMARVGRARPARLARTTGACMCVCVCM